MLKDRTLEISLFLLSLFLILGFKLVHLSFFSRTTLLAHPTNSREILKRLSIERGEIYDRHGELLATNKKQGRLYKRVYPHGVDLAHLLGYFSPRYGESGLEAAFERYLSGYVLSPEPEQGCNLNLTIDLELQKKANELLNNRKGAIVALNPQSGEVLALASSPSFDPNKIDSEWGKLTKSQSQKLFNRALQGRYPPGSTFKILTLGAALDEEIVKFNSTFAGPGQLRVDGSKVSNYGNKDFGRIHLKKAFALSVNTVFAQVGLKLGEKRVLSWAKKAGFNRQLSFDLPVAVSSLPPPQDQVELAWDTVGQGRVLVTPMQMTLLASAVANGGKLPQPYLVSQAITPQGQVVYEASSKFTELFKFETAFKLKEAMKEVVESGTGRQAFSTEVEIAGKTGTAEIKGKLPHAWFVGFGPAEQPQIVVTALIEEGGTGSSVAAPVAKELILTYLRSQSGLK
jgi:peptidoglycan glycosyltransferase